MVSERTGDIFEVQGRWGWRWACSENGGRNPDRVGGILGWVPKVGLRAAGQPWAVGRNPVGIGGAEIENRKLKIGRGLFGGVRSARVQSLAIPGLVRSGLVGESG